MIEFAGRTIIPTTLDPIPPLFRIVLKHIALNQREISNLQTEFKLPKGSALTTFKHLIEIVQQADNREAMTKVGKSRRHRHRN